MKALRQYPYLIILVILTLILSSCNRVSSTSTDADISTLVAQTQTAAVPQMETAEAEKEAATDEPTEAPTGDLRPLSPEECEQLAGFMINRMFIPPVEQDIVAVERQGETGTGCQAIGVGDGNMFPEMIVLDEAMQGILEELGWTEDTKAPSCLGTGGWGPGANSRCFMKADAFCELFVHIDPIEESLCSDDEPITACFSRLQPDEIIYTAQVTCARDISPTVKTLESPLIRIKFEPGAIDARELGEVAAGGIDHYVLKALEGQEMTVNLLDRGDNVIPPDTAVLVIWGDEGTVLVSSHADARFWSGELPFTQDYFIDVKSISSTAVPYTLEIIIPPPKQADPDVIYRNANFGFSLPLPDSWEGYTVLMENWEGTWLDGSGGDDPQGPMISIVHPDATTQQPRQNIPIMVFTIEQWNQLQLEEFSVSAAPFPPAELGRNSIYVFGLPPRYNYAYLEGWEEVEQILSGSPLVTFDP